MNNKQVLCNAVKDLFKRYKSNSGFTFRQYYDKEWWTYFAAACMIKNLLKYKSESRLKLETYFKDQSFLPTNKQTEAYAEDVSWEKWAEMKVWNAERFAGCYLTLEELHKCLHPDSLESDELDSELQAYA